MAKISKRKKIETPLDDFYEMDRFFDEYMTRIKEEMADFFDDALSTQGHARGFVYGFHMTSGPDGKPVIEEFGKDITSEPETGEKPLPKLSETRLSETEPLTDVIDEEKVVRILAELPGVDREDIKIDVKPDEVIINVDTATRKYHKEIKLPCEVRTDNIKTTHKNGILEIITWKTY